KSPEKIEKTSEVGSEAITNVISVENFATREVSEIENIPNIPVPPITQELLCKIFPFFSLRDLRVVTSGISKKWCIESLLEQKKRWREGNIVVFDNIVFDTKTGEKLHIFEEEELSDVFHEKRPTLIYTRVPEPWQILGN